MNHAFKKEEEDLLFPALEEVGIPRQGPIGVMLAIFVKNIDLSQERKESVVGFTQCFSSTITDFQKFHIL